ncbi:diacylglycerol kinase family lipid kinase [Kovacikia minuta CCNUW1]|uniref:diacylglycerol/lipid kinase family protein n=1 Tax=Kovacikia minuta TaxID=2931930 RepID=UPI001CCF3478|nr:diacylglycerol kinase family protein [Kovacikia minuta]UBF27372.1 diacylglycerol kinase family lipid kinase [Kovacikia minuta CCNUW1]
MKRARLIMNPVSGVDEPNPMKLPEIIEALEAENIRAELAFTKPDESPRVIAQQAVQEGYDLVIVGGGDGTVSEVAKGLLDAPIPLGIVPFGTYNNIARSLDLPIDIKEACQVLSQGQIKQIDVGLANDEHYFFEAAGVGLDAILFPLGEEIKGGRWGRLFQAFQLAAGYRPQPMQLRLDRPLAEARTRPIPRRQFLQRRIANRSQIQIQALLVVIANGPYYGTGFMVAPDAVLDDGLLTVTIYRGFSKWELVRHFWSISRGQYHYNPKIETYQVATISLTAKARLPVHADGQSIGEVPVTFKVAKQALKVMVPAIATPTYQLRDDPNPPVALPVDSDNPPLGRGDNDV